MSNEMVQTRPVTYRLHSIGQVRRTESGNQIEIAEPYRAGLKELGAFSHVMVFWWADQFDNEEYRSMLLTNPPYADGKLTGVFATRSPYRPNPIAMTTCKILSVDESSGVVKIGEIDSFDGTHVVDLKAYFPVCDRVKEAQIPDWLAGWPEWMPEEGIGL